MNLVCVTTILVKHCDKYTNFISMFIQICNQSQYLAQYRYNMIDLSVITNNFSHHITQSYDHKVKNFLIKL